MVVELNVQQWQLWCSYNHWTARTSKQWQGIQFVSDRCQRPSLDIQHGIWKEKPWIWLQPYHSVGNNPPTTFNVAHGGLSHGYDYTPYHTVENDPHPSFGMAHEEQNHGYDYRPHNTAFDIPLPTFGFVLEQLSHYFNHNPYYSITDVPPLTFYLHVTSRDREEEGLQL